MLEDSKQKAYNARELSEANENLYRELKLEYQRLLRKSKKKAKRKFMLEDMNIIYVQKYPYKCLKKLAADQNNSHPRWAWIYNNSRITNKLEIMKKLSKSFFPDPKPIKKKTRIHRYIEYLTYLSNDKDLNQHRQ